MTQQTYTVMEILLSTVVGLLVIGATLAMFVLIAFMVTTDVAPWVGGISLLLVCAYLVGRAVLNR